MSTTAEVGSFTVSASGNKTILLNDITGTPSVVEFEMGPRSSTNETDIRRSSGWTDFTRQRAIATFNGGTRESNSYCIMHYKDVAGTATLIQRGSKVSAAAGQFTVNFAAGEFDSGYTVSFKAFL